MYISRSSHRQKLQRSTCAGVRFPNKFWIEYDQSWTKVILQLRVIPEPTIYTFDLPYKWDGDIICHKGPSLQGAPIAVSHCTGLFRMGTVIMLAPPRPGFDTIEEDMNSTLNGVTPIYTFRALRDRPSGTKTIEKYEWSSTIGPEGRGMGEFIEGWKLRCITRGPLEDNEVLAVFADTAIKTTTGAKFYFLNSAAEGGYGELWYLMVVMTFLRIWQKNKELSWQGLMEN